MQDMPYRVIALLLAVVLLWPGLQTVQLSRVDAPSSAEQVLAFAPASESAVPHESSVLPQPPDDLVSQAVSEPAPETPGLLAGPVSPSGSWTATSPPRSVASAGTGAPFLAGPLRPPCRIALAG
jgi:hypothetical protein